MIRHSSSFFISLIIHTIVAIVLFYTYKTIVSFEDNKSQKVELKLCCIVEKKDLEKPVEKPSKILKPIPIKPKIIKKSVPLKEIVKKEEPVVEDIKTKEKVVIDNNQEIIQEQTTNEETVTPEAEYLDEHIKRITELLQENLYYPRSARKRGITGEVIVKFTLHTNASVDNIKTISSTSDILSRAAVRTIEDLSGEFPKPKKTLVLKVPIKYSLSR